MRNANTRWVAAGAALVAAAVGGWLLPSSGLSGAHAPYRHESRSPVPADDGFRTGTAAPAARSGSTPAGRPAYATAAPAESPEVLRAREMYRRLLDAVGPNPVLPEDLRRDLLAFLSGDAAARDALFAMVWEERSNRMVLGHLKLFLIDIADGDLRRALVAALESHDPGAATAAGVRGLSGDPALLAAELRSTADPMERTARVFEVQPDVARDPRVAELLLDLARTDPSEEVRSAAYNRLAQAGIGGAVDLLTSVAGDPGRSEMERMAAAGALPLHPAVPSEGTALSLYEGSPDRLKPHLVRTLGRTPSSARVDGVLLDALTASGSPLILRRASANAIGERLFRLPADEARDLGSRVAAAMKRMDPETTVSVLEMLGASVMRNDPLREAVVELHRTSPKGGVIQLAIASSPALRMVAGL